MQKPLERWIVHSHVLKTFYPGEGGVSWLSQVWIPQQGSLIWSSLHQDNSYNRRSCHSGLLIALLLDNPPPHPRALLLLPRMFWQVIHLLWVRGNAALNWQLCNTCLVGVTQSGSCFYLAAPALAHRGGPERAARIYYVYIPSQSIWMGCFHRSTPLLHISGKSQNLFFFIQ